MSIPKNISKEHIDRAIENIDESSIPSQRRSYNYFLKAAGKELPPKYVISIANLFANNQILDDKKFNAGETVTFLEKLGYKVERKEIMPKIKLYDTHGKSAEENFRTLLTPDDKYFYWDFNKFKNYGIGDIVFFINRKEKTALYTKVAATDITPAYEEERNIINDMDYTVTANAKNREQFETFYRFAVHEKANIPDDWDYTNPATFGNMAMAYILYEEKVPDQQSSIEKINDIKKIFFSNEELLKTLDRSIDLLDGNRMPEETKKYSNDEPDIIEKFRDYLHGIHKHKKTSNDYIKQMPKIQQWFIDNAVVGNDYNIWKDTERIPEITEKLNYEFEDQWKNINDLKSGWYSAPWNYWVKFINGWETIRFKIDDIKGIIEHVHAYIAIKGFKYNFEDIANYYLSLRTKPFVILAGISGTGKTQLPRKFAEALNLRKNVIQVPVRPDWTDGSDLLGYTSLEGRFIRKDLTIAIQRAADNPQDPYFFILDEMNLARVEHYFSDFLSVIETRRREGNEIVTDPILREETYFRADNKEEIDKMGWPQNLYLIGTVNMDETTHAFSRKVLDRANSIEMNEIDLKWLELNSSDRKLSEGIGNDFFITPYISSIELSKEDKTSITNEMELLMQINEVLEISDFHFAYRVRDEIAFYLILNKRFKLLDDKTAVDYQLIQKILPRIHGSSERVQRVLVQLLNLLEGQEFRVENFEFSDDSVYNFIKMANFKYKRAARKIIFMLKRYDDDRFTSFWV